MNLWQNAIYNLREVKPEATLFLWEPFDWCSVYASQPVVSISQSAYPKNTSLVVQVGDTKYLGNIYTNPLVWPLLVFDTWILFVRCLSEAAIIPSPDHLAFISQLSYQADGGSHWYLIHKWILIKHLITDPIDMFMNSFRWRIHYLPMLTLT